MEVASLGPLRVSSLLWQPRPGAHALTVICKATFELQPGASPLAAEQEAPWERDVYREEDPGRSLRAASDLAPFKRRADVLVMGHARPPQGGMAQALVARVAVGSLQKAIEVRAERAWAVTGLGPVAPTWPARTAMLGRHAATWDHQAWNMRPLPEDVDGAFFNAAPVDQQMAELTGEETIVLEHLHPRHARLTTRLARVVPKALVRREEAPLQEVRLRCDTLTIDADRGLAMLVWRGVVVLSHAAERGVVAVAAEVVEEGAKVKLTATQPSQGMGPAPVHPFGQGAQGPAMTAGSEPSSDDDDDVGATTIRVHASAGTKPALPFMPGGPRTSSSAETRAPSRIRTLSPLDEDDEGTGTIVPRQVGAAGVLKPVLPFQRGTEQAEARGANATREVVPDAEPTTLPGEENRAGPAPVMDTPFDVPPPAMIARLAPAAEASPALMTPVVEKPPMIGPLASTEAAVMPDHQVAAEPPAAEVQTQPEPAPVELTIEQYATIAAEIAEGKVARAKVLEAHELDERSWRANDQRWKGAIEEESAQGRQALRDAYDAAYVARVEGFRGVISLDAYARILVGFERGTANAVLHALRIHRAALMPIVRFWTRKAALDMKVADKLQLAIREARRQRTPLEAP
jgi:hypothetical protein